jgi:hypothetical protein
MGYLCLSWEYLGHAQIMRSQFLPDAFRSLQNEFSALPMQGKGLIPELANQKDGIPGWLIERQGQFIVLPGFFQRDAHLGFRPKKAVRRHGVVQSLVGAEVVVVVDEMEEPLLGFFKLQWFHPAPEFFAHGLPETFAFA